MQSRRRTFFSRLSRNNTQNQPVRIQAIPSSPTSYSRISRFQEDDDARSVHSILPAYSRHPDYLPVRPTSPAPTYYSVGEPLTPLESPSTPSFSPSEIALDEIITRLHDSLKNPQAWRHRHNGSSFFWALRCPPGTADVLSQHVPEIRARTVGLVKEWKVQKFCVIFRGQRLLDLWCKPILTDRYGTHVDPLKEDYLVVQVVTRERD